MMCPLRSKDDAVDARDRLQLAMEQVRHWKAMYVLHPRGLHLTLLDHLEELEKMFF